VPVEAATWLVSPDGTGDYPTIQSAVDAASAGDVVLLEDGVFVGEGNHNVDYRGKRIVVRSAGGQPENCIIDCTAGYDGLAHRGFRFGSLESQLSRLEGVTIRNGRDGAG